ncbi:hypothetical protein OROGR_010651 [Orobanche gracilis]
MIIIDELPFAVVDRVTVSRDYTWSSITNLTYMCLTVHWIDKDMKLHKRILSFCVVPNHKGKTIGKMIENRLLEWGINKLLTVTVDNASANDGAIEYVKKNTKGWKGTILERTYLHMRCCAHILNLIVKAGLKFQSDSIHRIRNAIRYVRSSPTRLDAFKKCVAAVKIECKSLLCLDIETRWNSTYKMLEIALKFESAFERLRDEDSDYRLYFSCDDEDDKDDSDDGLGIEVNATKNKKKLGPPFELDWVAARVFVRFLKLFYDVTLKFSGTLNVTSNLFFKELVAVQTSLMNLSSNNDPSVSGMAKKMREKFCHYWENFGKMNFLLYVAVILDPRYKLTFVEWCLHQIYVGSTTEINKGVTMLGKVKVVFYSLYVYYATNDDAQGNREKPPDYSTTDMMDMDSLGSSVDLSSQFASYLEEKQYSAKKTEFDSCTRKQIV